MKGCVYMFVLVSNGCPDGYAFVRDHYGNKSYYGTIEDCKRYIKSMEKEYQKYINQLKRRFIK